jgi:sporulation protein YhbH
MVSKIERDHARFRDIVKGKIKQNLRHYITQGEMIGRMGKHYVSIPVPHIELPRFRYGLPETGGVSSGDGDVGTPLGPTQEPEAGSGEAGNQPGEHELEIELSFEELAKMLGEELELPNIQPKGSNKIEALKRVYRGIHLVGPRSLVHFKRTYKEALKRQISSGEYDPDDPIVIPNKKDFRYRGWKDIVLPQNNAVIIYMMDVSGSMGDEQKEMVRIESFWIDTWLRSQYRDIETRYIVHDASARQVDRETFFRTKESGGTLISSAYKLCNILIDREFPPDQWNVYPFHFSDGDNWSTEDTRVCVELLRNEILPKSNMFCYGQVVSRYGSGQFIKDLRENFREEENLILSTIENKEAIIGSIKEFLGKGK